MHKRFATVGLAAALAGTSVLGIGIAGAQTDDDTTPPDTAPTDDAPGFREGRPGPHRGVGVHEAAELLGMEPSEVLEALRDGETLAGLAEAAGVTVDELVAAMVSGVEERLADAVEDGFLTQEEADERLARITERTTALVNGDIEPIGGPRDTMAGVAELLGMEPSDVVAAIRDGGTLAELAAEAGVSVEALVDEMLENHTERLDRAVENGRLTEAEATERLDRIEQHVTDVVNGDAEPRRPRGRFGPGGPGPFGGERPFGGEGPFAGERPFDGEQPFDGDATDVETGLSA